MMTEETFLRKIEDHPGCIQSALSILGDKWSPLLLSELVECSKTFSELEEALPGISPRTLSARLDRLISYQVILKKEYCQHPPRYQYELTKKGSELKDILSAMADWGARHSSLVTGLRKKP